MSINKSLNNLLAKRSKTIVSFSAQVTTSSTYLAGPGGQAGDGVPLPQDARIYGIECWDGMANLNGIDNISVSKGDRVSVYATYNAGSFDVKVRVNGIDSALLVSGAQSNSTLMVSVLLQLQ